MGQLVSLSPGGFQSLLISLIHIEENLKHFTEFSETPREADAVRKLLEDYIMTLNRTIEQITVDEDSEDLFPYVVIGSEVTILAHDGSSVNCRIVSPLAPDVSVGDVSFLSPIGKALLLKEVKDTITVQEADRPDSSVNCYTIASIKL